MEIEAPITYLQLFTSEGSNAHPEEIIIITVKQMLFKVRRSLSSRLPHSIPRQSQQCRKIDALTIAGRISKAARLADLLEQERNQEDDARPIQGRITREQALAVLSDLFPEANDLDDLGDDLDSAAGVIVYLSTSICRLLRRTVISWPLTMPTSSTSS